jgi:hypothetical protein
METTSPEMTGTLITADLKPGDEMMMVRFHSGFSQWLGQLLLGVLPGVEFSWSRCTRRVPAVVYVPNMAGTEPVKTVDVP